MSEPHSTFHQDIHLSNDDWDILTEHGRLLSPDGSFDKAMFRKIMKEELTRYLRRELMNQV
jgi:hypothetical protein